MKNVRKAILKAITEANRVRESLDSERSTFIMGNHEGMSELEFDFRLECLDSERENIQELTRKLYDALAHIPA